MSASHPSTKEDNKDDVISADALAEADKAEAEGCDDILQAAKEGKVGATRHFLRINPSSLQSKDEDGMTPLHFAAENGSDGVVQRLLEAGAAVDAVETKFGLTPLHLAAEGGHDAVTQRLLEAGAAVDAVTEGGATPLHLAAVTGHDGVAQRLLEAGATVDAVNKFGNTPLHVAAEKGRDAVAQRLLEAGAAVDAVDQGGKTPHDVAKQFGHQKVMGLLHPVFVNLLSGRTCRCDSTQYRNIQELKEEAEKKLGVKIKHLIGPNMEPVTESMLLKDANVLPNSTLTAVIAAAEFQYHEVVFEADDAPLGLRLHWEPRPQLAELPDSHAAQQVAQELQIGDELVEVNDTDVTKLDRGDIEPKLTARPLKLVFRRKNEELHQAETEPVEEGDSLEDPKAFIDFLISANIRLVRLEFLIELHECGKELPRRQEAESLFTKQGATALVEIDDYKKLHINEVTGRVSMPVPQMTLVRFCAVSHMWESMEHPDPWRFQLGQIVEEYRRHVGNGLTWVFLDYVSLFQYRRTVDEDRWFYKALKGMHALYAHEIVEVLLLVDLTPQHLQDDHEIFAYSDAEGKVVLMYISKLHLNRTPHERRGWCQAEKQWSLLRITLQAGNIPLSPDLFRHLMQDMQFTHRNDSGAVYELQAKVFELKTSSTKHLHLEDLDSAALRNLRVALPHYKKLIDIVVNGTHLSSADAICIVQSGAREVQMESCDLNTEDAVLLAKALVEDAAKPLKQLSLRRNRIGDPGQSALQEVMEQRPDLTISMTNQLLTDASAKPEESAAISLPGMCGD